MDKQLEDPGTGVAPEAGGTRQSAKPETPKGKQRRGVKERVAAFRERHNPVKLAASQEAALMALPVDQRERLTNLAEDVDLLTFAITHTSQAIANGQEPHDPISLYTDVRDFVAEHGLASDWLPGIDVLAALDAEDQDTFSDREFVRYGLRLKPWSAFYHEFVRHLSMWIQDHPCDPAIKTEIETLAKSHDNTPTPYDGPNGTYSQKLLDRAQAEKYDFETELARYERERLANWNREIKERAQQPMAFFTSEIGGQQ